MPSNKAATLSPEVEKRIAEIERMTRTEVQSVFMECMSALPAGKITAKEDNALRSAARAFPDKIDHILSWPGMQRIRIG
jgi:hypothetical protein